MLFRSILSTLYRCSSVVVSHRRCIQRGTDLNQPAEMDGIYVGRVFRPSLSIHPRATNLCLGISLPSPSSSHTPPATATTIFNNCLPPPALPDMIMMLYGVFLLAFGDLSNTSVVMKLESGIVTEIFRVHPKLPPDLNPGLPAPLRTTPCESKT